MSTVCLCLLLVLSVFSYTSNAQVTASQFKCMFPRVSDSRIQSYIPHLNAALRRHSINTLARVQMYMAQTGHETDSYNTFVEYTNRDGTNRYCPRYEGGCRYRGRGAIQLTHRANYARAGSQLGVDFVNNPDIVATPQYAFEVGGMYWTWRSLNRCSDSRDLVACTRAINGGTNGMDDRRAKYSAAQRCITSLGSGGAVSQPSNPPPSFTPPPPSFTPRPPPSSPPSSFGSCAVQGTRGSCINVETTRCGGNIYRGFCPGASNIRCCVQNVDSLFAVAGDQSSYSETTSTAPLATTIVVVVISALVAFFAIVALVVIMVRRNQQERV